jgi:curved DNA-binding protein CbpA
MPGEKDFRPAATEPPISPPQAVGTLRPGQPFVRPRPPTLEANAPAPTPERPRELVRDSELSEAEIAAMSEDVWLSDEDKRLVFTLLHTIKNGTLFDVLGVDRETPKRALKRAYFKLSKQFHPDRYYGKETGSFGPWLSRIFETANEAFDILNDDRKRAEYMAKLDGRPNAGQLQRFQTHEEHAAELFERACQMEVRREFVGALELFAAVARITPQPAYLRRSARCALAAEQLSLAEEYAKKAAGLQPDDPSSARLLASVFRAAGKLRQAEETLERALSLPLDNETLLSELQTDLDAVRKDLADER